MQCCLLKNGFENLKVDLNRLGFEIEGTEYKINLLQLKHFLFQWDTFCLQNWLLTLKISQGTDHGFQRILGCKVLSHLSDA